MGDEASIRSDIHSGTTWAPVGETPVVNTAGARFSINLILAVRARGLFRFITFEGRMTAERFIEFRKRLAYRAATPICLILEGHPVHKSQCVKDFATSTEGRLRLFILPPYSPHPNRDECVWNWLKHHNIGKDLVSGPDQFRTLLEGYLRSFQKLPRSFPVPLPNTTWRMSLKPE